MKDYSAMSDFDINHHVLSSMKIDGRIFNKPHFADGSSVGVHHEIGDRYEWHDYCNNPSDAMPILIDNRISLTWVNGECRASSVKAGYHEFSCGNALRAAMIVYLMMKDEG